MDPDISARELTALLPDPVLFVTTRGEVLHANAVARRWLGLAQGLAETITLAQLVASPPEQLHRYLTAWARTRELLPGSLAWRTREGGVAETRCDGGVLRPPAAGRSAVLLVRCRPKAEAGARFLALNDKIAALRREITARMRAEAEVRAQREWLRVALVSIGDAVITADLGGHVTFVNPASEALTGWPQADALGKPLPEVFRIINEQTRRPVQSPVDEVLARGAVVGLANHTVLIARDGTERPIEDSAAPIRDEHGDPLGVILVFHDVTERRVAERARDAFLARASHELRTPLTSALGMIRLLNRAITGQLNQPVDQLIAVASRNLDAMLALVNNLLDATKLAHRAEDLDLEAVDLARLAQESLEIVAPQADGKGLTLRCDVPAGLCVVADRAKLEQVLVNLLSNGVKFTPDGGAVSVSAASEGDSVVLRVADTGEGIAEENLGRIFEPFFQITERTRRRPRGTGLGLAISRQIVDLHGGRIWATSPGPGRGSTFFVELPCRPTSEG
jgi:PAS domain S-box-containing protein